ncbi:hypothetical protein LTR97_005273 [Elasticomyces elasticus]|uniref:Major facilitator superfamily (MFS) profile domain-containing protein n=1 Tax=Elasticomyces elasticus TaxID=574655 RepID=A0AAN7ZU81_9PEZI|nr:hypothetical protein LTR97_005273 [Elasticomyces elasticus]
MRDSQFGKLVRLSTGRKWLRYPDEIDLSLWTASIELSTTSGKQAENDMELQHQPADVEGREKPALLVTWYGSNDAEICLLNFAFYIASSIYTPGERAVMEDFGVSEIEATLGLSLFTLGYGLGPMLWSPLSEIPSVGRNDIYFFTSLAFVLLQLPTGFAIDLPMFLIFRLLAGFVGCPALATGAATIMDMYGPAGSAIGISFLGFFGVCGPVFGPILGGFSAQARGWRICIWIVAWLGAFVTVMLFFCLPETAASTILYCRAKRLRKATGDERIKSQSELDAANYTMRDHLLLLSRAFTLTFSEPIVFALDLYTALLYGLLFIWFESFPLVFGDIYHFDLGQQGLVFLGIFTGGVVTLPFFLLWIQRGVVPKLTDPQIVFRPEMVLPPTFFGSACLPICLLFFGWSARQSVHWMVPVVGSSFFTVSIITLFNPVLNYLGITYPHNAASIFAGNALFRASFGAIFPLFVRYIVPTNMKAWFN